MIYSTKRGKYCSFWCQRWSNHPGQEVLWWNRALEAVEAVEASEVAEADEVDEPAEVLRPEKSKDFRVMQVLEFNIILMFWKYFFLNINEISCWILAPFLLEAVETSQCYFFEKWLWHPKIPYLSIPEPSSNQI